MNRRKQELEDRLALAERHVREGSKRIEEQRARIALGEMQGWQQLHSHRLLHILLGCQVMYERDRDDVELAIQKLAENPFGPKN